MALLRSYAPHNDESGLGYYRRLAADNALWGWRELARMGQVSPYRTALLSGDHGLALRLGLDTDWVEKAATSEATARSWRGLHRHSHDAVCPQCLSDAPYLRANWEHGYVTACVKHQTLLLDRCPTCGERLSDHRERIEQCPCGQDLRALQASKATPVQLWLSALVSGMDTPIASTTPHLTSAPLPELTQLVKLLCSHFDLNGVAPRRNAAQPSSVDASVAFLAPLECLLADWPQGFERHVRERIRAGNPNARTLNSLLGAWYGQLKKSCQSSALRVFLEQTVAVAVANYDGLIGEGFSGADNSHVRLSEAAKAIGVSRDTLLTAVQEKRCAFRTRRLGTRGLVYEIPHAEVHRIKRARQAWMSEAEAMAKLGIAESILRNMVAAQLLTSDAHWRLDPEKGGPILRASVQHVYEQVKRHARIACCDGEIVLWSQLTSRRMGDKASIQHAMQAAANGDLKAVVVGDSLGQMGFLMSDVKHYFATPILEAGMTVQELSHITGWKWESISHWIEQGLLEAESIKLRGQHCRVVLPHHLLAFRQNYMPLAELARGMGTKSAALSKLLSGVELVGALQLPSGASRGGLIRLAELGKLAVLGARAGYDLFVPAHADVEADET